MNRKTWLWIGILLFSWELLGFDSYEHIATGTMGVNIKFPGDQQVYEDFPYKTFYEILLERNNQAKTGKIEYTPQYIILKHGDQELKLGYGEIIAIAGDFIGMTDGTISDGVELKEFDKMRPELEKNFRKAFDFMLPYPNNPFYAKGNLEYLRGLFKNEYKHLITTIPKKYGIHFNNASSHSVTNKVKDQWAYSQSHGYADLLSINVDHFEDDAKLSYGIGHTLALEKAKEARELEQKGEKEKALDALNLAYAMDAFGSHFLTDLFSAGHLRTPRGGLLDVSKSLKYRAMGYTTTIVGLMANAMHDEDNFKGLWLKNGYGQIWVAFGDGSYFDMKSLDNRDFIRDTLQASVDEVYEAYKSGTVPRFKAFKALKMVGVPLDTGKETVQNLLNHFPLFRLGKTWPEVRKSYYDIAVGDYQAITSVTGITSFLKSDLGTYDHGNFLSFLNTAHLVDSLKRDVIVECYNTFDRDSMWPSKQKDYTKLGEGVTAYIIDNKELTFHTTVLQGNLRPDGTYYVVNEEVGAQILQQCATSMEIAYKIEEAFKPDVIEIRGRIDRGYSHPIVVFDKDGKLRRLKGYKS